MKYIWLTTLTVLATYSAVVDAQNDELLEQKKTVSALADTSLSDEQFSQDYKDIDTDKVLSKQDQCPNSHRLRGVDNVGCELDADHDGIFDHNDQCPSTPQDIRLTSWAVPLILTTIPLSMNKIAAL